jgi:endonuclease/exonuclease/phosphatase family metal-dependent hydrolase
MPDTFLLGTFNVENLFARYRFRANANVTLDDGFTINQMAFSIHNDVAKRITAQAIRATRADILCLQEVESLPVLDRFQSNYLARQKYKHRIIVDAHDPRYIDVGILSRYPIVAVRTHRHERNEANTTWLFSRDCLEVDVDVQGKLLTLYVNHFKSMIRTRAQTHDRRKEQVDRVARIIKDREDAPGPPGNYVVLGDFNDYPGPVGESALGTLLDDSGLVNTVARRAEDDRWTHYWAGGGQYRQLDYILLPEEFDKRAGKPTPEIIRSGLPWRAERYEGDRFDEVGYDSPKASDHAPVVVEIPMDALK